MRILLCTQEAPLPPLDGLRLQVSALSTELRRRHTVRVLGYRWPGQQGLPGEDMRLIPAAGGRHGLASVSALLRSQPPGVEVLARGLRPALLEELERFEPDVVHVTPGRLASVGGDLLGRPTVLAALDAWHLNVEAEAAASSWARRATLRRIAGLVRRFEATRYRKFGAVVVVTDRDRLELEGLDPSMAVSVIPNGVDLEAYGHDGSPREPARIVFTGVMGYAPNVTAAVYLARRVFPRVRTACPSARLAIVGRDPRPEVQSLDEIDGVEVPGGVDDIRPWLSGSRAFACPMRTGTGIKNKLLEAMANGLPCVVTPLALQGLQAVPGEHLLVGEDEVSLAGHLVRLLSDDDAAESLGRAGHDYVRDHHAWSAVASAYERLYEEVIVRPGGAAGQRDTAPPS